jgi:CheY-like chemotaxis protein
MTKSRYLGGTVETDSKICTVDPVVMGGGTYSTAHAGSQGFRTHSIASMMPPDRSQGLAAAGAEDGPPLRILCVEDDPYVGPMLVRLLQSRGYLPDLAEDGEVGLAKLKQARGRFALIITDNQLPKLSGLEVAERGRADGFSGPIIVYSSGLAPDVRSRYERCGVAAFIEKPSDPATLLTAIARASIPQ